MDEELRLHEYLEALGPDDRVVVLATYWLGRGHLPADSYPGQFADAAENLIDFVGYMLGKTNLARALRDCARILEGGELYELPPRGGSRS